MANFTGSEIVKSIATYLDSKDMRATDNNILIELRNMNKYEIAELVNFGEIQKWKNKKIKTQ